MADLNKLADFLREGRNQRGLTLREVEQKVEISNAYLSQMEGAKIRQPSPAVLHKLCELYGLSYALAMEYVGHPVPSETKLEGAEIKFMSRLGRTSPAEQSALLDYLKFIRTKRR